jgi:hypothetical protein
MRSPRTSWILAAAAAAVVAIAAALSHARVHRRSIALTEARRRNIEFHRLQDENRRLNSGQLSSPEREQLEAAHAEAEGLRARLASLQRNAAQPKEEDPEPDRLSAEAWINAGRETPRATIVSVLWAASRGDVDRLAGLVGFSPDVRERAEALFSKLPPASQQEYGSPEKVVATLLAGTFPKDASAATILADKTWGQDAAIAMTTEHSDGKARVNQFHFHRAPDGWQLLVPASVMAGYEKTVLGDPQSSETGAP